MTDAPYGGYPATDRPLEGTSTTDAAKESGQRVASTAAEQGKNVLDEGKVQARNLTHEVSQQAHEQTKLQKDKAASGLRSLTVKRTKKRGVRVKFASRPFELPFRSGDKLRAPFTVRVDVGVHSGTVILDCKTSEGGNATCPGS